MSDYKELLAKKSELEKTIAQARKLESIEALKTIKELIATFGFTAQQVFPYQAPERKKTPAKYYDPDSGKSWSGKGKVPTWLVGKDRSLFEIKPSPSYTAPVDLDPNNPFPVQ